MNPIETAQENLRNAQKRSKSTLDDILQEKGDRMINLISKSPKLDEPVRPLLVQDANLAKHDDVDIVSLHPQQPENPMETPRTSRTVISTASALPRSYPDTALDSVINNRGRGRGRGNRGRGGFRGNFRGNSRARGRGRGRTVTKYPTFPNQNYVQDFVNSTPGPSTGDFANTRAWHSFQPNRVHEPAPSVTCRVTQYQVL